MRTRAERNMRIHVSLAIVSEHERENEHAPVEVGGHEKDMDR